MFGVFFLQRLIVGDDRHSSKKLIKLSPSKHVVEENKEADKALCVGGSEFMSNVHLKQLSALLNGILPR